MSGWSTIIIDDRHRQPQRLECRLEGRRYSNLLRARTEYGPPHISLRTHAGRCAGCVSHESELTVGSKNFTEQLILGELLKQYLGNVCRMPVDGRFYLAGTYICQQAILAGRIDTYVEYTGTALAAILKEQYSGDPAAVYQRVKEEYKRRFDLDVMPPLGFNNSFAMVMRGDDARRLGVTTLSQLAGFAPHMRLGVGYEFLERQDGYKGLVKTYDLHFADAPRVMDLGLLYRALQNKSVDIVAGNNTDWPDRRARAGRARGRQALLSSVRCGADRATGDVCRNVRRRKRRSIASAAHHRRRHARDELRRRRREERCGCGGQGVPGDHHLLPSRPA